MCLIALAHRASEKYPLVIAANRDEDHERPTRAAHFWDDAPAILGGRDVLHGGSWLALRGNRFAAVTNLRGGVRAPQNRSRGALVGDFVRGASTPAAYIEDLARHATEYTPFHLYAGVIGDEAVHFSQAVTQLAPGVHGISNAPAGERWPKVDEAVSRTRDALTRETPQEVIDDLLVFLSTDRGTPHYEAEPFIRGDRYGTRASTVIVATPAEVFFIEQSWGAGGERLGAVDYRVKRQ
ncbi:MAG TPA: NRDE family protein [Thermoanaerobaculia bacterium]